ncbi:hypothetical protein [Luteococcus sp. OSA5]|uniref:hypothetical protein n=1 Tax=Luteococcus sp. OSA5 TaxID=3401630 RepID=UPI003B43023A
MTEPGSSFDTQRKDAVRPSHSRAWTVAQGFAAVYLIGLGALLVVFGQADDSPGLGGLGLINAVIGVVMLVRTVRGAAG